MLPFKTSIALVSAGLLALAGLASLVQSPKAEKSNSESTEDKPGGIEEDASSESTQLARRPADRGFRSVRRDVPPDGDDPTILEGEAKADAREAEEGPRRMAPQIEVFANLDDVNFRVKAREDEAPPEAEFERIAVRVVGPDGYRFEQTYPSDGEATFSVFGADGEALPDGVYKYEAYGQTELVGPIAASDGAKAAPLQRDENGRPAADPRVIERTNWPEQSITSGSFSILEGQIVQPDQETKLASAEANSR